MHALRRVLDFEQAERLRRGRRRARCLSTTLHRRKSVSARRLICGRPLLTPAKAPAEVRESSQQMTAEADGCPGLGFRSFALLLRRSVLLVPFVLFALRALLRAARRHVRQTDRKGGKHSRKSSNALLELSRRLTARTRTELGPARCNY